MLKLIGISLVIIGTVGTTADAKPKHIDGRIVGGSDANIEQYPYQLALIDNEDDDPYLACGAVLIHPNWALTSGFCTVGFSRPALITIKYNSSFLSKAESTTVSKIIRHPQFDSLGEDNNISILQLAKPLICKICKPATLTRANPRSGEIATITGWGDLQGLRNGIGDSPDRLKVVTVPVYPFNDCVAYFKNQGITVTNNTFCIGDNNGGKGFCMGDFGGPVVINGHLYGIMAFQEGCAKPNAPSGVTNVGKYVTWIEQVTGIRTD